MLKKDRCLSRPWCCKRLAESHGEICNLLSEPPGFVHGMVQERNAPRLIVFGLSQISNFNLEFFSIRTLDYS